MSHSQQEQFKAHSEQRQQSSLVENQFKVTVTQAIAIGSVAGAMEVLVNHPLWSIKTRIQSGSPLTFNPSMLYRGVLPNMASMVPITALQVGLNQSIQNLYSNLSDSQRMVSAFVAGVSSSVISCPTEMVMTYQSQTGGSFYASGKQLVKLNAWPCLFKGLFATAIREGMFTLFFLAGTPMLKVKIQSYCTNDYSASLLAGIGSGIGATLASQTADTLKTIQQTGNLSQPSGLIETAKKLYSTEGVYGFFKGTLPRGARVVSAVTIMGLASEKMENMFQQRNVCL